MLEKLKGVIQRNNLELDTDELELVVEKLNTKLIRSISEVQKRLTKKMENLIVDKKYSEALELVKELEKVGQVLKRQLEYLAEEDIENFYNNLNKRKDEDDEDDEKDEEDEDEYDEDEY